MSSTCYKGLRIIVSNTAMRELVKYGKTLDEVKKILEEGYDSPKKRTKETIEKWLPKRNKIWNAVITKDYNETYKEECWILIHLGRFTRGKHEMS